MAVVSSTSTDMNRGVPDHVGGAIEGTEDGGQVRWRFLCYSLDAYSNLLFEVLQKYRDLVSCNAELKHSFLENLECLNGSLSHRRAM